MSPIAKKKGKKKDVPVAAAPKKRAGRSLVIVESPTKQKTIAKFLGSGYTIMATLGHIRDLPSRSLGADESNGFDPQYVILPKAKKGIPILEDALKGVETVLLATDFDADAEQIDCD